MSEAEDKYEELLREYGYFIIKFEHICEIIREKIKWLIFPYDSNNVIQSEQNFIMVDILLESLTAEPLIKKLYALYIFKFKNENEIVKVISLIKNLFTDLITIRNSFSHGHTSFNYYDYDTLEEIKDAFLLRHHKIKKEGLDKREKEISLEKIKNLNDNVSLFADCINNIEALKIPKYLNEIKNTLNIIKFSIE